jgi:hypothetical protein
VKIERTVLTKDEARWLSRNISKTKTILEAVAKKDPQVLERTTYKTIKSLAPEAEQIASTLDQLGEEPFEIEIQLKVKQKRALYILIEKTLNSLENVILPKYREQNKTEYIEDVENKLVILKSMIRKFK